MILEKQLASLSHLLQFLFDLGSSLEEMFLLTEGNPDWSDLYHIRLILLRCRRRGRTTYITTQHNVDRIVRRYTRVSDDSEGGDLGGVSLEHSFLALLLGLLLRQLNPVEPVKLGGARGILLDSSIQIKIDHLFIHLDEPAITHLLPSKFLGLLSLVRLDNFASTREYHRADVDHDHDSNDADYYELHHSIEFVIYRHR